jgi:hypothetical protein
MTTELDIAGWRVTVPAPAARVGEASPPRLSALVCYRDAQETIGEAVQSLLDQTVAPYEIVVCDDGSSDDVRAGLGELLGQVQLLQKPAGGTGSAINAAARVASGGHVVALDARDVFEPRRIEAISAVLAARPDVDIVATDAVIEHEGEPVTTLARIGPFPPAEERRELLRTCTLLWPCVRRAALLDNGGLDESLRALADWDCWLRLVLGGASVAYVHEPSYRRRLTLAAHSAASRAVHLEDQVRLTEKALDEGWLDEDERTLADELLEERKCGLARELARAAVESGDGAARERSLPLLTGHGYGAATRAKAAATMVSPALASRFLARRRDADEQDELELAGHGLRLPA